MERNYVMFRTGLFLDEQADDELGQWSLGEDCARWLHAKLLTVEGVVPWVEPMEEDWGWMFGVRSHGVSFWIRIWLGLREHQTWIIGIEPTLNLFRVFRRTRSRMAKAHLCDAIASALASSPGIGGCRWFDHYPDD